MFSRKIFLKRKSVLLLSALVVFFVFGSLAFVAAAETKADEYKTIPFKFQVPIPDLKGSFIVLSQPGKVIEEGKLKYLDIPWIAEYVRGIYNFSVSVLGILCVVMVMAGGLQWLVARGDTRSISNARSRISNAFIGLILSLGSWTVLNFINPELVNLKSVRVGVVEKIDLNVNENDPESFWTDTAGGSSKLAKFEQFKAIVLGLNRPAACRHCPKVNNPPQISCRGGYGDGYGIWDGSKWTVRGESSQTTCPDQGVASYVKYDSVEPRLVCCSLTNFFLNYWYDLKGQEHLKCSGAEEFFQSHLESLFGGEAKSFEGITDEMAEQFGDLNWVHIEKKNGSPYHTGIVYRGSDGKLYFLHAAGFSQGIRDESFIYGTKAKGGHWANYKVRVYRLKSAN